MGPATFYVLNEGGRLVELTRIVVYAPDFGTNLFSPAAEWDLHGGRTDFDDRLCLTLQCGSRISIRRHGRSYKLPYITALQAYQSQIIDALSTSTRLSRQKGEAIVPKAGKTVGSPGPPATYLKTFHKVWGILYAMPAS